MADERVSIDLDIEAAGSPDAAADAAEDLRDLASAAEEASSPLEDLARAGESASEGLDTARRSVSELGKEASEQATGTSRLGSAWGIVKSKISAAAGGVKSAVSSMSTAIAFAAAEVKAFVTGSKPMEKSLDSISAKSSKAAESVTKLGTSTAASGKKAGGFFSSIDSGLGSLSALEAGLARFLVVWESVKLAWEVGTKLGKLYKGFLDDLTDGESEKAFDRMADSMLRWVGVSREISQEAEQLKVVQAKLKLEGIDPTNLSIAEQTRLYNELGVAQSEQIQRTRDIASATQDFLDSTGLSKEKLEGQAAALKLTSVGLRQLTEDQQAAAAPEFLDHIENVIEALQRAGVEVPEVTQSLREFWQSAAEDSKPVADAAQDAADQIGDAWAAAATKVEGATAQQQASLQRLQDLLRGAAEGTTSEILALFQQLKEELPQLDLSEVIDADQLAQLQEQLGSLSSQTSAAGAEMEESLSGAGSAAREFGSNLQEGLDSLQGAQPAFSEAGEQSRSLLERITEDGIKSRDQFLATAGAVQDAGAAVVEASAQTEQAATRTAAASEVYSLAAERVKEVGTEFERQATSAGTAAEAQDAVGVAARLAADRQAEAADRARLLGNEQDYLGQRLEGTAQSLGDLSSAVETAFEVPPGGRELLDFLDAVDEKARTATASLREMANAGAEGGAA